MTKLIKYLTDLINKKFYGEITIKFEGGEITIIREVKNIKL